ncbi:MAG: DNA-processing protein DprA [Alphaproteobacteria bacterium]|nr:DNA-processing protein DprA [Alphaproteobacteria bacterium]
MQLSKEQYACLQLSLCDGIGPMRMNAGLEKLGSYQAALAAVQGAKNRKISAASRTDTDKVLSACVQQNIQILFKDNPQYPAPLKYISDAPHLLYLKGDISILKKPCVSIVGTRNASINGLKFTEKLSKTFAREGLCVVSGLARGIDAAAHKGAIGAQGKTIAVLAGGLGKIYPPEHTNLAKQILEDGGLLISEMPPHTEHIAPLFPRRNRIVSGLSKALCVTESALKSGSLITARLALEHGRDVFAVPGHPTDPRAIGPNSLLKQGALWLEGASDVLTVYKSEENAPKEPSLFDMPEEDRAQNTSDSKAPLADKILTLLTNTPTSLDELCKETETNITTLTTTLTLLDMDGHIAWHGSNKVSKVVS